MVEEWRYIKKLDNKFKVSNLGNIFNVKTQRILKPSNINGYRRVHISKNKTMYIHRLVAETFIPNPENKPFVNHIDGNRQNNMVKNLEWCTQKENVHHAWSIGLCEKTRKIASTLAVRGWKARKNKKEKKEG